MIAKLYETLEEAGFNVFSPAKHEGAGVDPYVVVAEQEQVNYAGSRFTGFTLVYVIVYVHLHDFMRLEEECEKVRQALRGKFDATGYEGKPIVENDIDRYSRPIQYIIKKKLRG